MKIKLSTLAFALILSALIVSGCGAAEAQSDPSPTAAPTQVSTAQPTQVATVAPTENAVQMPDSARARDLALAYLSGRYGEQAPAPGLTWRDENITPEGLVGSQTLRYTTENWDGEITVTFPVVAPDNIVFQVVVTDPNIGLRWQGEIDATGQVTETRAPADGIPVVGWLGNVVSTPEGAQYDDYLVLQPEGAGEVGVEGVDEAIEAKIVALRDKEEPGKYAHFWGSLICDIPDYGGCQLLVTHVRAGTEITEPEPVEDWEGFIISNPPGSQFDDYFLLAGDWPVGYGVASLDPTVKAQLESLRDSGTTIRVRGQLRTGVPDAYGAQIEVTAIEVVGEIPTPAPTSRTEPVENWWGEIVSNPPGSQFDDYFQRQIVNGDQYGIESLDADIQAQIVALRDTGTTVHLWGTLYHNVPDYNASQIQVTRIEVPEAPVPPDITEEAVQGWIGTIGLYPPGSQLSDHFVRDDGERYGIQPLDGNATVRQLIEEYQWTGAQVQVWGRLLTGVPDVENRQIQVKRIEALSGPAQESRNLSPFAEMSASSVLPSDRWGTYHAWSAIDGSLSTPWSEGADGPGVGEWITLEFPSSVEVHSIGIAVGYDRDEGDSLRSPEVFAANNRLKRATLFFSNGEQVELSFSDIRGVQMKPLARAPNPITTTFVKVVIEEVYPGSKYDDTCLAEIELWGKVE